MSQSQQDKDVKLFESYKAKALKAEQEHPEKVPHFWKLKSTALYTGSDAPKTKKVSVLTLSGAKQAFSEKKEGRQFVYYQPHRIAGYPADISAVLARVGIRATPAQIIADSFTVDSDLTGYRSKRGGTRTSTSPDQMSLALDKFYDNVMIAKANAPEIKAYLKESTDGKARAAKSPKEKKSPKKKSEKKTERKTSPSGGKKTPKPQDEFARTTAALADKGLNITDKTRKMAAKPIDFNNASKPTPVVRLNGGDVDVRLTFHSPSDLLKFVSEVLEPKGTSEVNLMQSNGSLFRTTADQLASVLRSHAAGYVAPAAKPATRSRKKIPSATDLTSASRSSAVSSRQSPRASVSAAVRSSPPRASVSSAAAVRQPSPSRAVAPSPARRAVSPPRAAEPVAAAPRAGAPRTRARGNARSPPPE